MGDLKGFYFINIKPPQKSPSGGFRGLELTKGPLLMKTKRIIKSLYPLFIAAAVLFSGCVFNVDRITRQKSGEVSSAGLSGASFDMRGYACNISVNGTGDSLVKATATLSEMTTGSQSESAADKVTVSIATTGGIGSVSFSNEDNSTLWELLRLENISATCNSALDISAKASSGNIDLTGINGAVSLEATSGNITATVVSGCDISVTSGNINLTLKPDSSFINATLKTTSGNIKVYVPGGFAADLDLKTTSGNIHTPGDDHSHLNGGDSTVVIKCTATSGNIKIEEED
jgi:hypothetical protein